MSFPSWTGEISLSEIAQQRQHGGNTAQSSLPTRPCGFRLCLLPSKPGRNFLGCRKTKHWRVLAISFPRSRSGTVALTTLAATRCLTLLKLQHLPPRPKRNNPLAARTAPLAKLPRLLRRKSIKLLRSHRAERNAVNQSLLRESELMPPSEPDIERLPGDAELFSGLSVAADNVNP